MTNFLIVAPVLIPLSGGVVLVAAWGRLRFSRALAGLTLLLLMTVGFHNLYWVRSSGITATSLGDWPAPFGIVLVADLFSALMVCAASLAALAVVVFTVFAHDRWQEKYILPIMLLVLAGVNGAFMTGDIFNLFVFFEVTLIGSYALMAIGGGQLQMEAAFKYVVINVFASTLFLIGVGLLYGEVGTLNMAHISQRVAASEEQGVITAVGMLLLVAFGIKAAVAPFHFWLPGAYTYIPSGVASFFGGVLTNLGVYAMVRVFTLVLGHDANLFQPVFISIACLSMGLGAFGALAQRELRNLFSWDIISQVGYMVMGLGLFSVASLGGAIFFMVQYIPVKTSLFLCAGTIEKLCGTGDLSKLGGLARVYPILGAVFLIPALSLAGVPPFSGFWGKLALVQSGIAGASWESYTVVAFALFSSFVTLLVMTKIWQWAFWGNPKRNYPPVRGSQIMLIVPTALIGMCTIILVFGAGELLDITMDAARQLIYTEDYINAVNLVLVK
ncbi:Na+/H+ antiporter subunit D [SAR202 cluster bacterium AD-804-J14_MRT_500m]|nr:Na+/H+ antiporter subunit D [SAR202 cluster bacterium AD-804-J14_MRT_500m]